MKKRNYDSVTEELAKLEFDEKMAQQQNAVLDTRPAYKGHPKVKEYKRLLGDELTALAAQKARFKAKQTDFFDLFEWSKTIVKVCEWLELALDDYCSKNMDLPPKLLASIKPVPELTLELAQEYAKGLDEVTYNLQESQDFFQASVDGRLTKYHQIEADMIEQQLVVIRKFPDDNLRKQYVEAELMKDLQYVQHNMAENPEQIKKRHKMLDNHKQFFEVLRYHKDKLKLLGVVETGTKKYDPRFDHYKDD